MFEMWNPSPTGARVGDCAVRAVSKALGTDWETAYTLLCLKGRGSYYRAGGGSSERRSRDSRGRYSSNYYEAMDDMTEKLDELMKDAPDEKIKSEIQRLKQKIEQMQ